MTQLLVQPILIRPNLAQNRHLPPLHVVNQGSDVPYKFLLFSLILMWGSPKVIYVLLQKLANLEFLLILFDPLLSIRLPSRVSHTFHG